MPKTGLQPGPAGITIERWRNFAGHNTACAPQTALPYETQFRGLNLENAAKLVTAKVRPRNLLRPSVAEALHTWLTQSRCGAGPSRRSPSPKLGERDAGLCVVR